MYTLKAVLAADHPFDNYESDYLILLLISVRDKSSVSAECQSCIKAVSQQELNAMTVLTLPV